MESTTTHQIITSNMLPEPVFSQKLKKRLVGLTAQQIFSSFWLSAAQQKVLNDDLGVKQARGHFTPDEDEILKSHMCAFCDHKSINPAELAELFIKKGSQGDKTELQFIYDVAQQLCSRPLKSIFARCKLLNEKTLNSPGNASQTVPSALKSQRRKWSEAEDEALVEYVACYPKEIMDIDGFWEYAAGEIQPFIRTAQQCRHRWIESLEPRMAHVGHKPCWRLIDDLILAEKLQASKVVHMQGLCWGDFVWDQWTKKYLRRRWIALQRKYQCQIPLVEKGGVQELAAAIIRTITPLDHAKKYCFTRFISKTGSANAPVREAVGGRLFHTSRRSRVIAAKNGHYGRGY